MHVVLLNTEFQMNGAALLLFRWARHLVRAGHRVTAVHDARASGLLRDLYLAEGVELTDQFGVDRNMVVICNTLMAAPYVLEVSSYAPVIWWLHEGEIVLRMLAANPVAMKAFDKARAIIFPSATIRDIVYRSFLVGVPEQRMHIVPPGIDLPDPAERDPVATQGDRLRVVSVGSIYTRKRQADLIRAIARLHDLPIECILIGQNVQLEEDAVTLTRQAPRRFRFLGELAQAETMRLVAQADVFALPSASECLPLAPLEAGLRSRPVVLSDLPAHEGIWRHGLNCLMHPVYDVDLLAHMLRILAVDPPLRRRLGEAARRVAAGFRNDLFFARLDMVMASVG
jgi:glycosyltransferase involved in cell wall biosynthesis